MIINAIVAVVGIMLGGLVSHHVTEKETQSIAQEQVSSRCETYVSQMTGPSDPVTRVAICPSGISYNTDATGNEHVIPWRKIDKWEYVGSDNMGEDRGAEKSLAIKIEESAGFPFMEHSRYFAISCTTPDAQKVMESLERYGGRGRPETAEQ